MGTLLRRQELQEPGLVAESCSSLEVYGRCVFVASADERDTSFRGSRSSEGGTHVVIVADGLVNGLLPPDRLYDTANRL